MRIYFFKPFKKMPFKSLAQMRLCFATRKWNCEEWLSKTKKKLPEYVSRKKSLSRKRTRRSPSRSPSRSPRRISQRRISQRRKTKRR